MLKGKEDQCRALWVHVLIQAIKDLNKQQTAGMLKGKKEELELYRRRVKLWFKGISSSGVGSFEWICNALDVDEKKIRYMVFNNKINLKMIQDFGDGG